MRNHGMLGNTLRFGGVVLVIGMLAACGRSAETPTATPPVTATVAMPSTPVPGTTTAGALADRIAAAWTSVDSYEMVLTTTSYLPPLPTEAGTATPSAAVKTAVEMRTEVSANGARHYVDLRNGRTAYEAVVSDGTVYIRGLAVPGIPTTDPSQWIIVDSSIIPADSPFRPFYDALLATPAIPFSGLSASGRDREAVPQGTRSVDGRTCAAFHVADTTETAQKIDIIVSLDESGLPCSIESTSSGVTSVTTYVFNTPIAIATPAIAPRAQGSPVATPVTSVVASPIASPVSSPIATPVASPVSSPVPPVFGTPVGSPAGTPIASPIGSPIASPAASPAISPASGD